MLFFQIRQPCHGRADMRPSCIRFTDSKYAGSAVQRIGFRNEDDTHFPKIPIAKGRLFRYTINNQNRTLGTTMW